MNFDHAFYYLLIFVGGFIDSIAGGGGLITVPTIALIVGPGALAIGTNKIVGAAAAGIALVVYARNGQFNFKQGIYFSLSVFFGSFIGSQIGSSLPNEYFRWLMIGICPLILILVVRKDSLLKRAAVGHSTTPGDAALAAADVKIPKLSKMVLKLLLAGLCCGLYDGILGPGGGTIMLLSLLLFTTMPLLLAIGISKFANLLSATSALGGYALHDQVDWNLGVVLAIFATAGAFIGSKIASKKAAQIVRPTLILVVVLLFIKLVLES
ncbi:MAG: sulfite exporter TauE/SafE family protein [Bdellovibrionota bacterium]